MLQSGHLIHELEGAIASGSQAKRVETLRRVTDLFMAVADHCSEDQSELFDEIFGRLVVDLETKARAELARRLAPIATAPAQTVAALARDSRVEVATPVLMASSRLDDATLADVARTGSQQHLLAVSQRSGLNEAVTDVLVERGDQDVVRAVARNAGARFSESGFGILVAKSAGDEVLAETVGLRPDIPKQHFRALIAKASETVKTRIGTKNPAAQAEIEAIVGELAAAAAASRPPATDQYAEALAAIEPLFRAGELKEPDIEALACASRFPETAAALALLSGLPVDGIGRAMLDPRSDLVLIVAKAAGLAWQTVRSLLRMRRGLISANDLEAARDAYERLTVPTAQRAVRFYRVRASAGREDA